MISTIVQVYKSYRVAVWDNSMVGRIGLRVLVNELEGFCAADKDLDKLLASDRLKHDVVLLSTNGLCKRFFRLIKEVGEIMAPTPVVVHSCSLSFRQKIELVNRGVDAIIDTEIGHQVLYRALVCVVNGGSHYPLRIKELLQKRVRHLHKAQLITAAFTETQVKILKLLAAGLTANQVGLKLFKAEGTIDWHKRRMMDLVGANSTAELLLIASDLGIVSSKIAGYFEGESVDRSNGMAMN